MDRPVQPPGLPPDDAALTDHGEPPAGRAASDPAVAEPARPVEPAPPRPRAASFVLALLALLPAGLAAQAINPPAGLVWSELFVFAFPAAALVARAGLRETAFLRLGRPPPGALPLAVPMGLLAMVGGGAIQAAWSALLPAALVDGFDVTRLFAGRPLSLAVLILAATGLAPVCEELAFRGHLLSALRLRWRTRDAIWLSALAFAAIHLDPVRFPALLFLGAAYGWMSWRAGSIWPAVLAHAVNNAAATALALAWPEASRSSAVPQPETEPLAALAASLALAAPLVLAYQRTMPPPAPPEAALERGAAVRVRSEAALARSEAAADRSEAAPERGAERWPGWVVRAGWAAVVALALIGIFGRR